MRDKIRYTSLSDIPTFDKHEIGRPSETTANRFERLVNKNGPMCGWLGTKCWSWTGVKRSKAYGNLYISQTNPPKFILAHRYSWLASNGDIPNGLFVLHECDNKACVNPNHLKLGDSKQNAMDMSVRGRGREGSKNPNVRMKPRQVMELRKLHGEGVSLTDLANKYGITKTHVSYIANLKSWAHLTEDTVG